MTFLDASDEEIAKEVLKRLRAKGLRSLRSKEAAAPVSRGTLARWEHGDYGMTDPLRLACIRWLGVPPPEAVPLTEADEKLIAAKWMGILAEQLRTEATSQPGDGRARAERDAGEAAESETRDKPPDEESPGETGSD